MVVKWAKGREKEKERRTGLPWKRARASEAEGCNDCVRARR